MISSGRLTSAIVAGAAVAAWSTCFIASTGAAATPEVPGHVVLARAEGDALLIWDSTAEVATIVSDKLSDAEANARLERDALRVLAAAQPKMTGAKSITVRVVFSKTGDVSPVYGSPTFAGIERYATLKIDAADASSDRDKWKELAADAMPPAWVQFDVIGALPPR
jgi:hypothetical protein